MDNLHLAVSSSKRINVLLAGVAILSGLIIIKLVSLQIFKYGQFAALAQSQQSRKWQIAPKRGTIYAYNKNELVPLAMNQKLFLCYADPKFIENKIETAEKLSGLLGVSANELKKKFEATGDYVILKQKLPEELADKIKEANLKGIGLQDQPNRVYPEGELASQLLGFVNAEGKGQYGIEGQFNNYLTGSPGQLKAKTDVNGVPVATADNTLTAPKNGQSYVLTLDRNVQAVAEKYLKEAVESNQAASGTVVIMNSKTGGIIAMASFPTYDPNNFGAVKDYRQFQNLAISDEYEPGSGFKVITMSAGLDSKKVKPDTLFTDPGVVKVSDREIFNAKQEKHGTQTMSDVIQKSINTGVVFVLMQLGDKTDTITLAGKKLLYNYIKKFGFGVATGIELPGEAPGRIRQASTYDVNYANMTFGQGLTATTLQMVTAFNAVANRGKLIQPYIVDKVTQDGRDRTTSPRVLRRVVSSEAAEQIGNMMTLVVEKGSGWPARRKGYRIAGKTGTAQVPRADGQGYEVGKNIGSFVGFAPFENPKFTMGVRIDYPKTAGFAEETAVPVFGKIADFLYAYYAIPPN